MSDIERISEIISPVVKICSDFVGWFALATALIFLSVRIIKPSLKKEDKIDAAWRFGSLAELIEGAVYGLVFFAIFSILNIRSFFHFVPQGADEYNALIELSKSSGLLFAVLINAVTYLISSPAEELLFRGIIFGSFAKSFGAIWAVIISTALFVIVHLPLGSWFDPVFFTVFSLIAIWLRLRAKAIGPAVAFHLSYNLCLLFINAARIANT